MNQNKKQKYITKTIIIVFLFISSHTIAQVTSDSLHPKSDIRKFSLYGSAGLPEIAAIGGSYQMSDQFAIGFKVSGYVLRGRSTFPDGASGPGIKLSYFFPYAIGAVANCEISYLGRSTSVHTQNGSGGACEITYGYDSIRGKGLGVLFGFGGGMSAYNGHPPLFSLVLKLGLHLDL
jgi:hypothetical protein